MYLNKQVRRIRKMDIEQKILNNLDHIFMLGKLPITQYEKEVLDYVRNDIRPATKEDIHNIAANMSWSRVKELIYHN